MPRSFLRRAACLAASFALIGAAAAQSSGITPPATRSMHQGATAASPSGTSATMPPHRGMPAGDLSRDCAPTAAGAHDRLMMQAPGFRSDMSQCTRETDREQRAECVRALWERSGGTAACM